MTATIAEQSTAVPAPPSPTGRWRPRVLLLAGLAGAWAVPAGAHAAGLDTLLVRTGTPTW